MKHPELERLNQSFGWRPESVATWNSELEVWLGHENVSHRSVFDDLTSETISGLADVSWWYTTRNTIIFKAIRRLPALQTVWDVGSGSGFVTEFLEANGIRTIGIEPSLGGAVSSSRRRITSFSLSLEQLALPDLSISAVSMFDVLEHLENRPMALREVHRVLTSVGHLVLTLPALSSLWSQSDVEAGHYLRYSKRSIRRELEAHGFDIICSGYFFALTVLPLFLLRALPYRLGMRRAVATEATLGATGGRLGKLLAAIEKFLAFRTPFGSSLIVIARKR